MGYLSDNISERLEMTKKYGNNYPGKKVALYRNIALRPVSDDDYRTMYFPGSLTWQRKKTATYADWLYASYI